MKITVKLDKRKSGANALGFPVVVYATSNYKDKSIRIGYFAKLNEWNDRLAQPEKKHPKYYELLDVVNNIKGRIAEIQLHSRRNKITLADLPTLLFKKTHDIFYNAAIAELGINYRGSEFSALNSFDKMYPKAGFDEISYQMVEKYIYQRLSIGKRPAGVDSYIRSLRALWNKTSKLDFNPFSKHKIEIVKKNRLLPSKEDLKLLLNADLSYNGVIGGPGRYRDYWLLQFFLGGIDPEVLFKLRYDEHLHNGRILFNRNKGGSKVACNVLVPTPALKILEKYNCRPYFVPVYKSTNLAGFSKNYNNRLKILCESLGLSVRLNPKLARHTFINFAEQLLIDERIAAQIVGHKRKTTTSLYSNEFPQPVQDAAHLKIILL